MAIGKLPIITSQERGSDIIFTLECLKIALVFIFKSMINLKLIFIYES